MWWINSSYTTILLTPVDYALIVKCIIIFEVLMQRRNNNIFFLKGIIYYFFHRMCKTNMYKVILILPLYWKLDTCYYWRRLRLNNSTIILAVLYIKNSCYQGIKTFYVFASITHHFCNNSGVIKIKKCPLMWKNILCCEYDLDLNDKIAFVFLPQSAYTRITCFTTKLLQFHRTFQLQQLIKAHT